MSWGAEGPLNSAGLNVSSVTLVLPLNVTTPRDYFCFSAWNSITLSLCALQNFEFITRIVMRARLYHWFRPIKMSTVSGRYGSRMDDNFRVKISVLVKICVFLPLFSMVMCILLSILLVWDEVTDTHCKVSNISRLGWPMVFRKLFLCYCF